jgi:hypothetical protein
MFFVVIKTRDFFGFEKYFEKVGLKVRKINFQPTVLMRVKMVRTKTKLADSKAKDCLEKGFLQRY